jgi:hypothetical protein
MTTPSGQDPYFFTPTPPAVPAPTATRAQSMTPGTPLPATRSLGWLLGVGVAAVVVIALVIGFVVLAHKDKHNEGTAVLRPIQQAQNVALESELRSAAVAEETYFTEHGSYTGDLSTAGYQSRSGAVVNVVASDAATYCLKATSAAAAAPEYYSKGGGVSSTACS